MMPPFISRWLAQPAPLFAVEHAERPQAVHRAMAPSSERKSGCDSAVLASWCWPQNGHVVSNVIAAWAPRVNTSCARELRKSLRSSFFVGLRKPPLACSRTARRTGRSHSYQWECRSRRHNLQVQICPPPLITIDASLPKRPLDIQQRVLALHRSFRIHMPLAIAGKNMSARRIVVSPPLLTFLPFRAVAIIAKGGARCALG